MKHSTILQRLYDYITDALPPEERRLVEAHLERCPSCRGELEEIRNTLALIPTAEENPADALDAAYWKRLANDIEHQLRTQAPRRNLAARVLQKLPLRFLMRPSYAYAIAGTCAALLAAVLFFRWEPSHVPQTAEIESIEPNEAYHATEVTQRVSNYLRKSRVLLVGITNLDTPDEQAIGFSAPRIASRDLLIEGRYLRNQDLDHRSRKLLGDLEKILIELASIEEANNAPDIELIRGGIRQQNLLFKIRMAEASLRDTSASSSDRIF